MKYTEEQMLDYDPFFGEEGVITLHTKKIVKVRKSHPCWFGLNRFRDDVNHLIEKGQKARFEKALIDGDYFGSYYMCLGCLEKEMDDVYWNGEEDES